MRIPFRSNPHNSGIYIVEYLFVVLSVSRKDLSGYHSFALPALPYNYWNSHCSACLQPCAFLAGDYILLGRLTGHLNGGK